MKDKILFFLLDIFPYVFFWGGILFFSWIWNYVKPIAIITAPLLVICVAYALINTAIQDRKRKKIT